MANPKKLVGLCVLGVVAFAGVVWTTWNAVAARQVESALAALKAAGLPTSLAAIDRPEIPPHENAALVYLAAFQLAEAMPTADDDQDAFVDAVPTDRTRAAVARFAHVLELVRQAARIPRCAFPAPTDADVESGMQVFTALNVGRALNASAIVRLDAGDRAGAEADLIALYALGRAMGTEPTLMAQMVHLALHGIATATARDVVRMADDPVATLARLNVVEPRGGVARGQRYEVAFAAELIGDDTSFTNATLTRDGASDESPSMLQRVRDVLIQPLFRSSGASYLASSVARSTIYDEPYSAAIPHLEQERIAFASSHDPFKGSFVVNTAPMLVREAQTCGNVRLLGIGARALAHKSARGTWPSALADLGADAPAIDPASDLPFELRREGETLVLASPSDPDVIWRL